MLETQEQVVIVGAGVVGACCAYYAARAGQRVVVLDSHEVGTRTTAASGSAVVYQTKREPLLIDLTRRSKALYAELERDIGVAYRVDGSLILFRDPAEGEFVGKRAEWLKRLGVEVVVLDRAKLEARLPDVGPEVQGASYAPDDAEVVPQAACRAIARAAERLGVSIWTRTPVTGFDVAGGRVGGVFTPEGTIPCAQVVLAGGPWTGDLAGQLGVALPLRPQKGEMLFTDPLPPRLRGRILSANYLMGKFGAKSAPDGFAVGLAIGQEPDGAIKIGSTREWAEFNLEPTERAREALLEEVGRYLPAIARLPIRRRTVGLRPYCALKRPIVCRLERPVGVVLACGHGGDGVALAPITGSLVADLLSGKTTGFEEQLGLTMDGGRASSREDYRS